VGSQHVLGEIERLVILTVEPDGSTTDTIADRIDEPMSPVHTAVSRLVQLGLATVSDGLVTLTPEGQLAAADIRASLAAPPAERPGQPVVDVVEVARSIGTAFATHSRDRAAATRRARDERLASDDDRDAAVHLLSEAFAQGRLSSAEHDDRTTRALAARTHGELDGVLHGLGGLPRTVRNHPVRKVVFWVAAVLASPFLLLGTLALAFGSDAGDRLGGLFFLVPLVPALFTIRRWAWPRA
jgi:hypothetical protein